MHSQRLWSAKPMTTQSAAIRRKMNVGKIEIQNCFLVSPFCSLSIPFVFIGIKITISLLIAPTGRMIIFAM